MAGPLKITDDSAKIPDVNSQQNYFNQQDRITVSSAGNRLPELKSEKLKWINHTSKTDIVNFENVFSQHDYVSGFAVAEFVLPSPVTAFLSVGSDDAIKIWHNGKLIHKIWTARGLNPDDDLVPVQLVKGSNQLLIEVQDIAGSWTFAARFLNKTGLSNRLVKASGSGDLDLINQIIEAGSDVNHKNEIGRTPLEVAQINGRKEIVTLLMEKGAKSAPIPPPRQLIDDLYGPVNNKPNSAIAVLVAKDGKIVYNKGFGYADIEKKIPVKHETKFRIGSITKQFIGAAILKLQEQGKIKVTDKLSKYISDFPRGNEVSIHHLLTHTSGINSYTGKEDFLVRVLKPVTEEELLKYFIKDEYNFSPGEKFQYNNSGYFLLGYIIQKITGHRFGDYLKSQFFDPLDMKNSGVHSSIAKLSNEAIGYEKTDSGYKRSLDWDMSWAGGAGALYSTVLDMYKWNEALFNGKVLSDSSIKMAFTPVVLNNGSKPTGSEYGYGWFMSDHRGLQTIGHSGGLHGFISQMIRVPKENLTIVLLTNVTPSQVEINPGKIAEFYLWEKMEAQPAFSIKNVKEENLNQYAGRYQIDNSVMTITVEGDALFAQVSGQGKHPIYPSAPGQYFWKVVEATVRFIKNEKGEVASAEFQQGSFKITAPKMAEVVTIKLDSSVLTRYTGSYDYGNNILVAVTQSDGKIYAQATGDQPYEMFPVAENEFIVKELNAKLLFSKDAEGKVNSVKITMGGNIKEAPRVKK